MPHMQKQSRFSTLSSTQKLSAIYERLLEKKAREILALDLPEEDSVSEGVAVATATSLRHGQGLADSILELCRQENFEFLSIEGYAVGEWILIDLNDIIVHIFQEDTRELYRLDDLWPNAAIIAKSDS